MQRSIPGRTSRMIVSRIWAGLGNQLFQYAAGKNLATLHKTDFKLDCRWFGQAIPCDTPRRYELDCFNIHAERTVDSDLRQYPFTTIAKSKLARSFLPRWQLFLQKRTPYAHLRSYRELHFHFDSKFFDLSSDLKIRPDIILVTGRSYHASTNA